MGAMVGPCYGKCLEALGYNPGTIGACCGEKLSRANARRDFAKPRVSFKHLEQEPQCWHVHKCIVRDIQPQSHVARG